MKTYITLILLLLAACAPAITCKAPYVQLGASCCLDNNNNRVCDNAEAPVPAPTPAEEVLPVGARTVADVTKELSRVFAYPVPLIKDEVPAKHYEDVSYDGFTFYGSGNIDVLSVNAQSDYFTDVEGAMALLEEYQPQRRTFISEQLQGIYAPQNASFTLYTNISLTDLPSGAKAIEFRDRANVIKVGYSMNRDKFTDWIDPYGTLTIYVACPPNILIAFYGSEPEISKFAANYDGAAYFKELEGNLNEISSKAAFRANKLIKYCGAR